MRENMGLYHAKRTYNGKWVEGCLVVTTQGDAYIISTVENKRDATVLVNQCSLNVDPETVGQFTGCYDKSKKKKVYEHDIVWDEIDERYGVVEFDEGEFVINFDGDIDSDRFGDIIDCCYVEGNIFDNPELIGNGEKYEK